MTKQERFESRVHDYAARLFADRTNDDVDPESVARWAVEYVRAVDEVLAEVPHAEAPEAPSGWRPMSEIGEAVGWIVIAFLPRDSVVRYQFVREGHRPQPNDLAWLQLPPLPTVKR